MGECTDVQALEKISSEVDKSQIKITLSSHCIKAQAFLVDKLRKQSERQKEVCSFISNSNVKLEADIKQAEQEIQSLRSAYDTIRLANVELRKALLLAKESKIEIEEQVRLGEKKYEDLWLESKSRYESIPYVQKLLQTTETAQMLGDNIIALQHEAHNLVKNFDSKKAELMNLDKQRVIEMANYFVNERPITLNVIKEKSLEIKTLKREIEEFGIVRQSTEAKKKIVASIEENKATPPSGDLNISNSEDNWPNLYSNANETLPIPKLKFVGTDFDVLSAKLDQIKIKKVEMLQTTPVKRADSEIAEDETTIHKKPKKGEDNIPYFFSKPVSIEESINDIKVKCNFSSRKLINILEDIKLDKDDTYKIVSKVNLDNLKGVDAIGTDASTDEDKEATPMESEQIEEIDLTHTSSGNIVVPPTQFMDYTQEIAIKTSQHAVAESEDKNNNNSLKNSQENVKKRVSFDLPSTVQITPLDDNDEDNDDEVQHVETETNKTASSELDMSGVSDDGFKKIRDMILKKHNLDLSPQFVYAKNTTTKTRNVENVTSKFFQQSKTLDVLNSEDPQLNEINVKDTNEEIDMQSNKVAENVVEKDENIVASGAKIPPRKVEKSVSGFLFKHGANEIPDSLNVSISTTGFDEGDADFPHCLDSSLLLSPKADLPMPMSGENAEVLSQEVPNFLSGLRKTGLSFFGLSSAPETNTDNTAQNSSNSFNFNFGGDEKKNRGGLFSMFR